jgi:parallel beta-helix repeat protein
MRRIVFVVLVFSLLIGLTFVQNGNIQAVKASSSIHQGDLILAGNNVTTIENKRFDINGSIIVEENATLILKNAIINFTQTKNYEYKMDFRNPANGNPRLQALNSTLTSKFLFAVVFHDNSSAIIREITTLKCYLEAFDYSTVDVLDSTVVNLWAYEHSVLTVANSTITATLRGSDYSTVSASHCTTKYVDTWGRPTINISNSNITYNLLPQLKSVNCSVTGLNPGLFQSWNSLQDCSVVEAAEGFAPNITLLDTQILGWSLFFLGSSNATVRNSKLRYLYAVGSSTVNVCNSTYSYRGIEQSARVYVYWYLGVHVVDSIDQDVPCANVTAAYANATVASMPTDANGWARLTLMEKMVNATGEYPVGNYTVEATYLSYSANTTVKMSGNEEITLALEGFPPAIFIRADGSVDPTDAPISTTDNVAYAFTDNIYVPIVVERDNIVVDGRARVGYSLQGTGASGSIGIFLLSISNVTIKNASIKDFSTGIRLDSSCNNTISGNNITNNQYGISLSNSLQNTISRNNISANFYSGISAEFSNNTNIYGNDITAHTSSGIHFYRSSNNSISENNITANHSGITLYNCFLSYYSISGNNLRNNSRGIQLYSSSNNSIYHNNFINNTDQVYIDDSINIWDNGFEGNYWSKYGGFDGNNDGIGDASYQIDENNIDHYPLMGVFHSLKPSPSYHINVISNSTIESFEYFESSSTILMYVSNTTATQTFGFCRVCIPKDLISPPYTVIINDGLTNVLHFNGTVHENSTNMWIYFAYEHSTHKVDIIPEFPYFLIHALSMIATLLAATIYRRKHTKKH